MPETLIDFLSVNDIDLARKVCTSLQAMFGSRATFSVRQFPPEKIVVTGTINDLSNEDIENLIFFNAGFYFCAHLNNLFNND